MKKKQFSKTKKKSTGIRNLASIQATLSNAENRCAELFLPIFSEEDFSSNDQALLGREKKRIRRLKSVFISR